MQAFLRFAILTAVGLTAAGCAEPTTQTGRQYRAELARLSYPEAAEQGPSRDIHVVRRGDSIQVANRTARDYEDIQLWINSQYVRKIERLPIGTDNRYRLNAFVNRHGERFPLPGLLSPRKTQPVVLAEIYNPQTELRHRLTVQPDETEDE
jgi:hypothetical protein